MRSMRQIVFVTSMLCCMAWTSQAEPLPPRPQEERPLPGGIETAVAGQDAQCFLLPEWKELGHLVVDYRALIRWAPRVEVLYATEAIRASVAQAEAETAKAAMVAAQDRERVARAEADEAKQGKRRLAWVAGGLGAVAVVLGAVVAGMAIAP